MKAKSSPPQVPVGNAHGVSGGIAIDADPEANAIAIVSKALHALDPDAQQRVLDYVAGRLGLRESPRAAALDSRPVKATSTVEETPRSSPLEKPVADDLDGISPVAQKWIKRSGLGIEQLSRVFSVGGDEIDLVAKTVPGDTKKGRMRSVILLKGVAAYLGSGVSRVTHEQIKETCLHYDAYDGTNFAAYLKAFNAELGGTKQSGYTLTARGLTEAMALVKQVSESNAT